MKTKESIYLFIVLILIISTNVYFSCKLLPKQEGFMKKVKKEMNKLGKNIENKVLNKIPDFIKTLLIKKPIQLIPVKGIQQWLLKRIEFKKPLHIVLMQLFFACIQLYLLLFYLLPTMIIYGTPLLVSFFKELAKAFLNMFMYLFKTKIQPPRPETEKLSNVLPPELQHIMRNAKQQI